MVGSDSHGRRLAVDWPTKQRHQPIQGPSTLARRAAAVDTWSYDRAARPSRYLAMILHDFVTVELPLADVERVVLDGSSLLDASAAAAYAQGECLRLRVGPGGSDGRCTKSIHVEVGQPHIHDDTVGIPMLLEAVGTPGLFPRLDANVELAPLSASLTQLTFFGSYGPPLGKFGRKLDNLLLHRVAELTIRAFLQDMAKRIIASTSAATEVAAPTSTADSHAKGMPCTS
jgi:hypothetical protein